MSTITTANSVRCDPANISEAVVTAVAEATAVDPLGVEPLYTQIDPDALDSLFAAPLGGSSFRSGRLEFELAGCAVVVVADDGDLNLSVTPRGA